MSIATPHRLTHDRLRAFILDVIVGHPGFFRSHQHGGDIDLAGAERHIVLHRSLAGQVALDALLEVLEMHQLEAVPVLRQQRGRVFAGEVYPQDINLVADVGRIGEVEQFVEKRALSVLHELVAVVVVAKQNTEIVFQLLADFIEGLHCLLGIGQRKGRLLHNPRYAYITRTQRFGVLSDFGGFVLGIGITHAERRAFLTSFVQQSAYFCGLSSKKI